KSNKTSVWYKMEEEGEAVRKHCRRMISLVRQKQLESSEGGRRRTRSERGAEAGEESPHRGQSRLPLPPGHRAPPGHMCAEARPVPLQLISTLRLKTVEGELRRAAEVELHDPSACSVCEQEQASLALKSFIRRKKTQLQLQALKGRLNTHPGCGVSDSRTSAHVGGVCVKPPKALRCPSLDLGGITRWTHAGHSNLGLPRQRLRNVELPWQQMK
ncbi:hypothetical protein L3Q82_020772, partial [Scortum barcoo]